MTLLQLAGGQTWPNLLPVLGYRPETVYFLTSQDFEGKFANSLENLRKAVGLSGHHFALEQVSTHSRQPGLLDCEKALAGLDNTAVDLVNLTGGTKAMSIAAYRFAERRGIPAFYLDTRRTGSPFDDFLTGPMPGPFPKLDEVAQSITVRMALEAQGFPTPSTSKEPGENQLAFASAAAGLRWDREDDLAIARELSLLRSHLFNEGGRELKEKGRLREALRHPVLASPGSSWHHYLSAAADHGIIQQLDPAHEFLLLDLDPSFASADLLRSRTKDCFQLLEGSWFELAVLAYLRGKSSFSDIRWSVEADRLRDPNADSRGETDLVAFNVTTLNLHFISCKTTGPHSTPLDHIQGLRRRATKDGGEFAKAELWVFRPKSEESRRNLTNHCKEQNVTLRVYTEQAPP
jgi:hypothetical protein